MPTVVNHAQIPSRNSGELYSLAEYDDGTIKCSCPFGSRFGPLGPDDKVCRHIRSYRLNGGATIGGPVLPPASISPQELSLNLDDWVHRFTGIFSPVHYMCAITLAVIQEDNEQRRKEGVPRTRPKPLPDFERSILEELYHVLVGLESVLGTTPDVSSADVIAHNFLLRALRERQQTNPDTSNKAIAFTIHRAMFDAASEGT